MRVLIFLSILCFGTSCRGGTSNEGKINITGSVTDSLTNAALPKAKVTILTWYDAGFDKTDYLRIDTLTDNNGHFTATLEKGYKTTVASVATNYYPSLKSSHKENNKRLEMKLRLKKKSIGENNFNSSSEPINLTNYIIQNSDN